MLGMRSVQVGVSALRSTVRLSVPIGGGGVLFFLGGRGEGDMGVELEG